MPVVARHLLARQEIDARQSEAVKAKSGSRQNNLNSDGFRFLDLIVAFRVTQAGPESARTAGIESLVVHFTSSPTPSLSRNLMVKSWSSIITGPD